MLLTAEIRQKINNKYEEMNKLESDGKIEDASKIADEITFLNKELKVAEIKENREKEIADKMKDEPGREKMKNVDINRIFNKLITGQKITDEESKVYNSSAAVGQLGSDNARGGYLLPKEQELSIYEFRRTLNSLKSLCRIKQVTTRSGAYNVEVADTLELLPFEELDTLQEKDLRFAQKEWSVKDYGILHKISNTLLDDLKNTNVRIVDFMGRKFAKASVRTENKKIAEQLKKASPKTIKDINEIKDAINVTLDPSISATSKIVTNQTTFNYLDKLTDKSGLPLLSDSITEPGKKMYSGKTIEVFADSEIESSNKKNFIFYVGDFEEYMTFYERQGYIASVSSEAGFMINATYTKMIERFGVDVVDDKAIVCLEMAPPVAG